MSDDLKYDYNSQRVFYIAVHFFTQSEIKELLHFFLYKTWDALAPSDGGVRQYFLVFWKDLFILQVQGMIKFSFCDILPFQVAGSLEHALTNSVLTKGEVYKRRIVLRLAPRAGQELFKTSKNSFWNHLSTPLEHTKLCNPFQNISSRSELGQKGDEGKRRISSYLAPGDWVDLFNTPKIIA